MRYLPKTYSLGQFFTFLNGEGIEYVVLRWVENLEVLVRQMDVDILVSDEYFEQVAGLLTNEPEMGGIRIDLYGLSTNNGYNKTTYFPYEIARKIISSRSLRNGMYIPNNNEFFFSFLFHVVFHKAEQTGIGLTDVECNSENKYVTEIRRLENNSNFKITNSITLYNLTRFLKSHKWFPPIDWLRKSAVGRSDFLRSISAYKTGGYRSIFVLRHCANDINIHRTITRMMNEWNFELIRYSILASKEVVNAKKKLRGGLWDKGPYELNGGEPFSAYDIEDKFPEAPNNNLQREYPHLMNSRFLMLKNAIRKYIQEYHSVSSINGVHCTDDDLEYLEYSKVLFVKVPKHKELSFK